MAEVKKGMILSKKLKSARISRKISQKTLAETLGVSRATLSAWESGETVPPVQYLRKYQELFRFEKGYFDQKEKVPEHSKNMTFDTSQLNGGGIKALENFYQSIFSKEEYLKKS